MSSNLWSRSETTSTSGGVSAKSTWCYYVTCPQSRNSANPTIKNHYSFIFQTASICPASTTCLVHSVMPTQLVNNYPPYLVDSPPFPIPFPRVPTVTRMPLAKALHLRASTITPEIVGRIQGTWTFSLKTSTGILLTSL